MTGGFSEDVTLKKFTTTAVTSLLLSLRMGGRLSIRKREQRGEENIIEALAVQIPDVFYSEILPKLDLMSTLNLAQVSKWYNDAVWSVDGVRSLEAKIEAHEVETGKSDTVVHPMFFAAIYGNVPAVRALLKSGVDVDTDLDKGYTPLHGAVRQGHTPVVKALIEADADVKKRYTYRIGYTVLHLAAIKGHAPVITELIKAGADVNATEDQGLAPLHYAVQGRHEDCVALLLAHGADVHKSSSRGIPAMKFAVHHKNKKIIKMLKQAGG